MKRKKVRVKDMIINTKLSKSCYVTKVLMPMMEYVEGCMVNDGNYSYMSGWANIW